MEDVNENANKFYVSFHAEDNICTSEYKQNEKENDKICKW